MRTGFVTATSLALLVFAASTAQAGVVIDTRPGTAAVGVSTSDWVGQTFTAAGPVLSEFGFLLSVAADGNLFFAGAVYETTGGLPTGAALYTGAPLEVTIAGTYSFSPDLAITTGTVYAITAQVTTGSGLFGGSPFDPYSGGNYIYSAGSGTPWFGNAGDDGAVLISMTPEPSTLLLFGVGLTIGVVLIRRRRTGATRVG